MKYAWVCVFSVCVYAHCPVCSGVCFEFACLCVCTVQFALGVCLSVRVCVCVHCPVCLGVCFECVCVCLCTVQYAWLCVIL